MISKAEFFPISYSLGIFLDTLLSIQSIERFQMNDVVVQLHSQDVHHDQLRYTHAEEHDLKHGWLVPHPEDRELTRKRFAESESLNKIEEGDDNERDETEIDDDPISDVYREPSEVVAIGCSVGRHEYEIPDAPNEPDAEDDGEDEKPARPVGEVDREEDVHEREEAVDGQVPENGLLRIVLVVQLVVRYRGMP